VVVCDARLQQRFDDHGAGRSSITVNSGNTYRFRIDGSHIEQYTWGAVNPFGWRSIRWEFVFVRLPHETDLSTAARRVLPSFGEERRRLGFGRR
jgi:hypothetical protein